MKNMFKRFLALILALTLLSLSLISCDESNTTEEPATDVKTDVGEGGVEPEYVPDIKKNNYDEDFYLWIQPNSNHVDYYWSEEGGSDPMSESIYSRQQQILNHIGVNIVGVQTDGHDKYGESFKIAVKTANGAVDSLLSHAYMYLSQFIAEGYLTDYDSMAEIDLEADYWNKEVMEEVAAVDKLYLGYSDFRLAYTHVVAFNKKMFSNIASYLEENPYEMVDNYHWTLDKMLSLANLVYSDTTGDGKTEDDVFGITGRQWAPFIGFLQASNINLVSLNSEGDYLISVYDEQNKEKTANLVEKLHELSKSNSAWFKFKTENTPMISLSTGRTLMYICSTTELADFVNYNVEFGVLPYPMYDENQKSVGYRSLDWGGWLCIPSTMNNKQMTGETLELLAYYSDDVTLTYYEKLIGKQVADVPDDSRMLDIIWNSVCSDIGLTYSHIHSTLDNNLYMLPTLTQANATSGISSYIGSYEKTANKQLRKFFNDLEK